MDELRGCPVVKRGSCHGNPFFMLRRDDVMSIVEAKKASDPAYRNSLEMEKRKKEIKAARAAVAEATRQIETWTQKKTAAEAALRLLTPVTTCARPKPKGAKRKVDEVAA